MAVKKLRLRESENGSIRSLIRAVQNRMDELEFNLESSGDLEDFHGYEFDPNSSWETIYNDVINPVINAHLAHIGVAGYTQEEAEDDIDAIVNMFDNEFGEDYPNVHRACLQFWSKY